ncbi:hypothetical protein C1646_677932 [Rhizophagus diaphanus]|nr:hypothetical protein C1646_677932 [Rhizophagus diaphanus] [Rhizophagus sp. MUCL 43196]
MTIAFMATTMSASIPIQINIISNKNLYSISGKSPHQPIILRWLLQSFGCDILRFFGHMRFCFCSSFFLFLGDFSILWIHGMASRAFDTLNSVDGQSLSMYYFEYYNKFLEDLIVKVEALLLKEPLDSLCGTSAVYLTIENDILPPLEYNFMQSGKNNYIIPIYFISDEIWRNPIFISSASRSEQSERTYISDVLLPLLHSSLSDLLHENICLSTAERQSIANKAQQSAGVIGERMGKKPDIMGMMKQEEKVLELIYAESSCIICTNSKKKNDKIKLWREALDGMSFIEALCRPLGNQFGIVGIQIAGTTIQLNVLMKDLGGIPRYFHLEHAEIPLSSTHPILNPLFAYC